jgi:hypothetical protein
MVESIRLKAEEVSRKHRRSRMLDQNFRRRVRSRWAWGSLMRLFSAARGRDEIDVSTKHYLNR